jgi:hypothetical protein
MQNSRQANDFVSPRSVSNLRKAFIGGNYPDFTGHCSAPAPATAKEGCFRFVMVPSAIAGAAGPGVACIGPADAVLLHAVLLHAVLLHARFALRADLAAGVSDPIRSGLFQPARGNNGSPTRSHYVTPTQQRCGARLSGARQRQCRPNASNQAMTSAALRTADPNIMRSGVNA